MQRVLLLLTLLALIDPFSARAQGKPDFSGTWTLDMSKSEVPPGRAGGGGGGGGGRGMGGPATLSIKQTATELTIESTGRQGSQTSTYRLDGSESTNPGMRGGEAKSKTHWDGTTLVTEQTQSMDTPNGEMTITSKTVRSLGADGKEMTVVTTANTPMGERTTKLVYTKGAM